jgi:hypothetical protein
MFRPPPNYDEIERKRWSANAKQVLNRLRDGEKNLLKRIATFIDRFGFPEADVKEKIRSDSMFAAHFAMEPRRQGIHEKMAAQWIQDLDEVQDFKTLPKSGQRAYYITSDGEIRLGMKPAPSKSLDFLWKTGDTTFYAAHKYTKEGGGNQDSQFIEMRNLLQHFMTGVATDSVLMVIVDGPYYTENRMKDLRRFARTTAPCSYAIPIQDVPTILKEYLSL